MNTVYQFGGSSEIEKEKNYIVGHVKSSQFLDLTTKFSGALINNFIVDEKIELTPILILFHGEYDFRNHSLYWTDKKL